MNKAPDQGSGVGRDNGPLPGLEFDSTFVFVTGTVLGEETRPVLPISIDIDTADLSGEAHLVESAHYHDVTGDLIDDLGVPQVAGDSQGVHTPRHQGDVTVAQINPEEVGVRLLV
jgi:hypothetical protein